MHQQVTDFQKKDKADYLAGKRRLSTHTGEADPNWVERVPEIANKLKVKLSDEEISGPPINTQPQANVLLNNLQPDREPNMDAHSRKLRRKDQPDYKEPKGIESDNDVANFWDTTCKTTRTQILKNSYAKDDIKSYEDILLMDWNEIDDYSKGIYATSMKRMGLVGQTRNQFDVPTSDDIPKMRGASSFGEAMTKDELYKSECQICGEPLSKHPITEGE